MKLPNGDRAIVSQDKLINYLLDPAHERGGSKAKLLIQCGYTRENWQQLEEDIRTTQLVADIEMIKPTMYGIRFIIRAPLQTPSGRDLSVKTVWQIDNGTDDPRLITLVPD